MSTDDMKEFVCYVDFANPDVVSVFSIRMEGKIKFVKEEMDASKVIVKGNCCLNLPPPP
jgi:hypothetical protein